MKGRDRLLTCGCIFQANKTSFMKFSNENCGLGPNMGFCM